MKQSMMQRWKTRLAFILLAALISQASLAEPTAKEIEFQSEGAMLSGTLFMPEKKPRAAVVLVIGSGTEPRLSALARQMALDGFAAFAYDKRGVGRSGGFYEGFDNISAKNLNLLGADAAAAVEILNKHVRGVPLGLVGFSQAGWVIPIAATMTNHLSFIGFWSAPACTVSEERHFSDLAERNPIFWETHSAQDVANHMRSVFFRIDEVDPRTALARLSIPGLWLFGGKDNSIPVALSIQRLDELVAAGHDFKYEIFPDYGHTGLADSPGQASYQAMLRWIRDASENGAGTKKDKSNEG